MFDHDEVITVYSLKQAVEDGVLVELFRNRWNELSGGKPIVASAALYESVSLAGLLEIWNGYASWGREVMPALPEEDKMFSTTMNGRRVWVIEDEAAFTLLYPEDY